MKKPNISILRSAIKKNGFKLKEGSYGYVVDGKIECGCVITHLYCATHKNQPIKSGIIDVTKIEKWADKAYGVTFSNALIDSFDNNIKREDVKEMNEENSVTIRKLALAGFDFGQRARNLLPVNFLG